MVLSKCKASSTVAATTMAPRKKEALLQPTGAVDLANKMLRDSHMGALAAAINQHGITSLDLSNNQLTAQGASILAEGLQQNSTLRKLECAAPCLPNAC